LISTVIFISIQALFLSEPQKQALQISCALLPSPVNLLSVLPHPLSFSLLTFANTQKSLTAADFSLLSHFIN
jgi:hypothetical protein